MTFEREYWLGTERHRASSDRDTEIDAARSTRTPGKHTEVERRFARQAWQDEPAGAAVPGRRALTDGLEPSPVDAMPARLVQRRAVTGVPASVATDPATVHAAAARGTQGAGSSLPHLDRIQRAFGRHDVSGVRAYVGDEAARAAHAMGAIAFATGDRIAFAESPSLETAAHEAAHVVQQRGGVQLAAGVGQAGDTHERIADAVAERVAAGTSAEDLLDRYAPTSSGRAAAAASPPAVQHRTVLTELQGELVTDELTRDEILAIYKQHKRLGASSSTLEELRAAIVNHEHQGAGIDLASVREWPRDLKQIIVDNKRRSHKPDLYSEHTVGLEVEFGFHDNPLLNFTHIELARSSLGGYINNLPFKLETDAGSTVELVTPPLWMNADEEQAAKDELEVFARDSVSPPVTIADWVKHANATYPMSLQPVDASEIRRGVNMYNVDEGLDIAEGVRRSQSETLEQDVAGIVLSPSKKDPTGAHTQINKAISIADYGDERGDRLAKIRQDMLPLNKDRAFLKGRMIPHGLWDDAFAAKSTDVDVINAAIRLCLHKHKGEALDFVAIAYLWQSHMECVATIFRGLADSAPERQPVPTGRPKRDTNGVCTLIGEKSVTGALGTIGENLELIIQKHAWEDQDPSLFKIQDDDSVTRKKAKAMASWHTHVKDVLGSWFKGDLRQVLLNEEVEFRLAENPGALEKEVLARWEKKLPVQLIPYHQALATLGVTVEGGAITDTTDAWCKLPLPDPFLYVREWKAALCSICRLIEEATAEQRKLFPDTSFHAPGFLEHIDDHRYNPREDTMIRSQSVRLPEGGGEEHQYVVEKR